MPRNYRKIENDTSGCPYLLALTAKSVDSPRIIRLDLGYRPYAECKDLYEPCNCNRRNHQHTEFDLMDEFRKGIDSSRRNGPRGPGEIAACVRKRQHNAYYVSWIGDHACRTEVGSSLELCEIAVELNPKEIQFHLNLGEVYASAGLREKALDKLDHDP
jgi:hypothetical protein